MIIPPRRALEGMVETLEKVIIPELSSTYAKGQAFAAVSLLQGLSVHWGPVEEIYADENRRLRTILKLFAKNAHALTEGEETVRVVSRRIRSYCSKTKSASSDYENLRSQNIVLRSFLNEVLVSLDLNKGSTIAEGLRRKIRRHLKHQVDKELRLGVESKMREVSKG